MSYLWHFIMVPIASHQYVGDGLGFGLGELALYVAVDVYIKCMYICAVGYNTSIIRLRFCIYTQLRPPSFRTSRANVVRLMLRICLHKQ